MQCQACGTDNSTDRRFCAGCGAPLAVTCAGCGFQNQPDARFCGGCGQPLGSAAAPAPATAPPQPPPPAPAGGERRQVTILFADIVGFTELSSTLDAEELHALVSRFFAAADRAIEHYGGTVDKHMGDAVMALFGAPLAHGDDPLRAVRAAFDIHGAMVALSAELGRELRVHVGIASGEVVAGGLGSEQRQEYTVLGDSVNLASRLDGLAEAGQTLIAEAVHRAVAHAVDCESLGEVAVKGLDKPVRVWRARGLAGEAQAAARGPLVGRKSELRQLAGVIEACREAGVGQAVALRGEAGIGKTRLVEEFTSLARAQGYAAHKGLVLDFGVGKGQDAIRSLVRSLLGMAGGGKSVRAQAAEDAVAAGWLLPDQRVFVNDLLDLAQPIELHGLYDAMDNETRNRGKQDVVAALIVAASGAGPLILTIEDAHWAGALTLSHLARMTATVRDCAAVLVMTTRIEGDPLDSAWRAETGGAPLLTIDLAPLREAEALELAGELLEINEQIARDCIARAEGNPLFLEQLLQNAAESTEEAVPASIQSLVLARMDRLPGPDKVALQAASVIGQRFALGALRHLIEDPGYDCGELVAHHLVRPEGGAYLFAHALIREGVYSSLLNVRKRDLHGRAARYYGEDDPLLRAEHLDRAEDPAAPEAYLNAAKTQLQRYLYDSALGLTERGLEVARETGDKFALTCLKGQTLHDLSRIPESIEASRRAIELAGDDVERCQALFNLAAGMRIIDEYDEAFAALERAEDLAQRHGLTHELAKIHHLRGNLCFPLGRIDECLAAHEQSLEFARRSGTPEPEAEALGGMGDAAYALGRMASANEYFRRCVELSREHGFGRIEVANFPMVAHTLLYIEGPKASMETCSEAIEGAARVGHHRAELNAELDAFFDLVELDRREDAMAHLENSRALIRLLGSRRFEASALAWKARVLLAEGQGVEAAALAARAVQASYDAGVGFDAPRIIGILALATEDRDERRRLLAQAEDLLAQGSVGHNHLMFYRDAIDVCLADRDWDGAERYAGLLEDFVRPEPFLWGGYFAARGRALAAAGRGRRDPEILAELARLCEQAERAGFVTSIPALEAALKAAENPAAVTLP
jgi:class 3 adenylate cyclase/tetratricopeptide (TPR) repeat protein